MCLKISIIKSKIKKEGLWICRFAGSGPPPSLSLSPALPPGPTFRPREHLFQSDTAALTPLSVLSKHPEKGEADLSRNWPLSDARWPLSDLRLACYLLSLRPTLISFGSEHLCQLFCNPGALSLGTVSRHIPLPTYHPPSSQSIRMYC